MDKLLSRLLRKINRVLCICAVLFALVGCAEKSGTEADDFPAVLIYAHDCECAEGWAGHSVAFLRRMDGNTYRYYREEAAAIAKTYNKGDTIK